MFYSFFRILIMGLMVVIGSLLVVGAVYASLDAGSREFAQHQINVAAADAATAASLANAAGQTPLELAKSRSALDGVVDGRDGVTITVQRPPGAGKYAGREAAIEVVIHRRLASSFLATLWRESASKSVSTISARAVVPLVWASS